MTSARPLARPRVPFRVTFCLAAWWCFSPYILWVPAFPSLFSFGTFVRGF